MTSTRSSADTAVTRDSDEPFVSIIVPLKHHFGHAEECIESWATKQTYPRERLELIVVSNLGDRDVERDIRRFLAPQDHLIVESTDSYYGQLNAGAERASGDILFFTESHAIGLPECIQEIVGYLETENCSGASTGITGAVTTFYDSLFDSIYDEDDRRMLTDPTDWRKLALRGFAIWKSAYTEHGPFEEDYGIFSERVVSIRLHQRGVILGYAPNAVVKHYNTESLSVLGAMVQSYISGECLYRYRQPTEHSESYLGYSPIWSNRFEHRKDIATARFRALLGHLMHSLKNPIQWFYAAGRLAELADQGLLSVLGIDWPIAKTHRRMQLEEGKIAIASALKLHARSVKLIRDYWHIHLARFCWLRSFKRMPETVSMSPPDSRSINIAESKDEVAIGFFNAERNQGMSFRWSQPEAVIRTSIRRGQYAVELQILPNVVDVKKLHLSARFDNSPLTPHLVSNSAIRFELKDTDFSLQTDHTFSFACRPTSYPSDSRRLGLPVRAIHFLSKDHAEATAPRQETELVGKIG